MNALDLADAAATVRAACRRCGLVPPSFVSRPGPRAVRRNLSDGTAIVYVPTVGRSDDEVLADMIDGALAANDVRRDPAMRDEVLVAIREMEGTPNA